MNKWKQLVAVAKEHGKTEQDVCEWFAYADISAIRDMTDQELVEYLMEQNSRYSPGDLASMLEDNFYDEETMSLYEMYMLDSFKD